MFWRAAASKRSPFDAVLLALIWAGDQNQGSFQLKLQCFQVLRVLHLW